MAPSTFPVSLGESQPALTATLYPAGDNARRDALLVFAHGAGAGQSHPFMVRYAQALAARGITVVTFNFPYMEKGRGAPDRAPVLEAAFRRVIAAAAQHPQAAATRVFIGGKSMGGRIATHLAATPDDWPAGIPPLRGVVVFGYPLNPPGGPSRVSPDRASHLLKITVPTLIVQGTRDTFGGPDQIMSALGTQAGTTISVMGIDGADHSLSRRGRGQDEIDQRVWDGVAAFVSST